MDPFMNIGKQNKVFFKGAIGDGALAKLQSFKASMEHMDLLSREKAIEEERRRERERPLEEAREEIRILNGKLERREQALKTLRRKVALDMLQFKLSNGDDSCLIDIRNSLADENKSGEVKIMELQELLVSSKTQVDEQQVEIDKLRAKLRSDYQKYKDRLMTFERQNYSLLDHIHRMENEKKSFSNNLHSKEIIIDRLTNENEYLKKEIEINTKAIELEKGNQKLAQQLLIVTQTIADKDNEIIALKAAMETKVTTQATAEFEELRKKYVNLYKLTLVATLFWILTPLNDELLNHNHTL